MIKVKPLKAIHVLELKEQGALGYLSNSVTFDRLLALEQQRNSYTIFGSTGRILACCGIIEFWEGRGEAWAFFSQRIGAEFIPLHKTVLRFLNHVPVRRIEAVVDYDFLEGHRWMRLLGFTLETRRMDKYNPGGRDASRYVRLQK